MNSSNDGTFRGDRRRFLGQVTAGIVAGAALARATRGAEAEAPGPSALPTMQLGTHRISRLLAGYNPIAGYSYLGHHMDQHMREYFTVERTVEFLRRCEAEGISAHQFSPSEKMTEVLRSCREGGSKMHFICLHSGRDQVKGAVEQYRPAAMAHHGGVTDRLFGSGKAQEVHAFVKEAHDRGVLAGVSAHNPDCIKRIADEGWEVDFFMGCFYFLTRKAFPKAVPQDEPQTLQIAYPFYRTDPQAMTAVLRQVTHPCLGFKILGAGRMCSSQQAVQKAFEFAFGHIKPTDGVIVGMYPRFFDEVRANVRYARQFGSPPKA
ncbi:MAG TPA: hypothetical protein VM695_09265 [Phycisphaerae bacterium]|nr:hypothetical protein [Phycisphaerae bacterium]